MKEKIYLGIDIGGTSVKYAYVTENGQIYDKKSFDTSFHMPEDEFIAKFLRICHEGVNQGISGIGISSLGVINRKTGAYLGGVQNLPFLKNINFKNLIHHYHPELLVSICNDGKAAALGELWIGEGVGCENFICVTLGTGIGGALVIEGKLIDGYHYRAGEIGYTDYQSDEEFFERYFSTEAVMANISKKMGINEINGIEFFEYVRKGNVQYQQALNEWLKGISRLLANCVLLVDPEKIIIGGGISKESDIIIPIIEKHMNEMLPLEFRNQIIIACAKNANDAGIIGAVAGLLLNSDKEN